LKKQPRNQNQHPLYKLCKIARIFERKRLDIVELQAQDRWQAIEELISHLVTTRKIQSQHRDSLAESIRKRESSMSTGNNALEPTATALSVLTFT